MKVIIKHSPTFKYKKSVLKDVIKHASWSLCYMCDDRRRCSEETKKKRHCIPSGKAKELNAIIDLAYALNKVLKEKEMKENEIIINDCNNTNIQSSSVQFNIKHSK